MVLTVATGCLLEVSDLSQRGVLTTCAKQVAQAVTSDTAIAALIEEGKGLLVVGGSLRIVLVRRHGSE